MKLIDLENELSNEMQYTENGVLGFRTTGKELLDLNFATSSLRKMSEDEIYDRFVKAFYENKLLAIKWLFFLRDARGGMGERRSFRAILKGLATDQPKLVKELIPIVAEYGRADDLLCLLDTNLKDEVLEYYDDVISSDIENMLAGKSITLFGKWLPRFKSKNDAYARIIALGLGLTQKEYKQICKELSNYSNVIECKMSRNEWGEIDYSAVPSKANVLYRNAFTKHDEERRLAYLESLVKGEVKINSSANFPHDIVHAYRDRGAWDSVREYDQTLEELWKALPDYVNGDNSTIVVADGSGSMNVQIDPKTKTSALEVANALAIYFSEKLTGEFKDKYITFSSRPQLVDMGNCNSLREKIHVALAYDEVANTDIYKVFKLILDTAVKNNYTQDELPKNILVISDMEFDYGVYGHPDKTLFENIAVEYAKFGFKMSRLIFWNVNSRTQTIPVVQNENGVILLSGFSPSVVKMALSGNLDPYDALLEQLNSPRYNLVEETFNKAKQ